MCKKITIKHIHVKESLRLCIGCQPIREKILFRVSSIAVRLKNKPTDYQSFKIVLKSKFIKSHIT